MIYKKSGFTLLEILVSIVIGGIILASAMSAYATFSNTSQQISAAQNLQREVSFALARVGDRIRAKSIGYDFYGNFSPSSASNQLFLGDKTHIIFENENLWWNQEPLLSKKFRVTRANFQITPSEDPFSENLSNFKNYRQPQVHINFSAEDRNNPTISVDIKTTISSRLYQ